MSEFERNTLEDILKAAKSEFMAHGYQAASLRTIASKADATTGALYGYFRNKEELFEALVGEQYNHMLDYYRSVIQKFEILSPEQYQDMFSSTQRAMIEMKDYMYDNYDVFKLLLCCSEGTRFNHMIHELAKLNVEAAHDLARGDDQKGHSIAAVNPALEHMLTSGMFATFFELIVHDVPEEEADEYIQQMLSFYSAGWLKLMGL